MENKKIKSRIYLCTFSVFLVIYLILMASFSVFLVSREKKAVSMELRTNAIQINNRVGNILQGYLGNDGHLMCISKVSNELLQEIPFFTLMGSKVAVFTGGYELFLTRAIIGGVTIQNTEMIMNPM